MKWKFLSLIALCLYLTTNAQVKPLNLGDTLPDLVFDQVVHYPTSDLKIYDLKGKVLLFDFWNPNCIGCIQAFPKMDSLQQRFKDSLCVILVNAQSRDSTLRFFSARKKIVMPNVILITGDSLLSNLFPHVGVPFHVWIDKNGVVRHFADSYQATAENVSSFISGSPLQLASYIPKQNYIPSLFNNEWQDKLKYYSYISNGIRGTQIGSGLDDEDSHISINFASAVELYITAYNEAEKHNFSRPGRLHLNIKDSFKYLRPQRMNDYDRWFSHYSYNYDLRLPKSKEAETFRIMKEDLDRYFDLRALVKTVKLPCWVLVRTSSKDKLKSKIQLTKDTFRPDDIREPITDPVRYFYNQSYKDFSARLGSWIEYYLKVPFIDATGFNGIIDIEMKGEVLDKLSIPLLRKALQRYDLDLIRKDHPVEVLQIEEKN